MNPSSSLHAFLYPGMIGLLALLGGCASLRPIPGFAYYHGDGYVWCWDNGYGWRYLGRHGEYRIAHNGAPVSHYPAPPPGAKCPPEPGHDHRPPTPGAPPCYYYIASDHTVSASADGKSYQLVGRLNSNGSYTPLISFLAASPNGQLWNKAGVSGDRRLSLNRESGGLRSWFSAPNRGSDRFSTLVVNEGYRHEWSEGGSHATSMGSASQNRGESRGSWGGEGGFARGSGGGGGGWEHSGGGGGGGYSGGSSGGSSSGSGGGGFSGGGGSGISGGGTSGGDGNRGAGDAQRR